LPAPLLDGFLPFSHTFYDPSLCLRDGLAADADGLLWSPPLAGIGLRSLTPDRQVAPMAEAPVRADLLEALDVQRDLATEIALDLVAPIDELTEPVDLVFGEIADPGVGVDIGLRQDLLGRRQAEAVDVGQGDL